MKIVLLGAPGAGKGTQAEIIARLLSIPTISTGKILLEAIKKGTAVGLRAKEYMLEGKLVPDDVIISIIKERLQEDDCKNGYVLDGVPRTIVQAEAMDELGVGIDLALSIEASDAMIIERMTGRRVCSECNSSFHISDNPPRAEGICDICGGELVKRADDDLEIVSERLSVYHEKTEPLKEYYAKQAKLKLVNSQPALEDTTKAVMDVLGI